MARRLFARGGGEPVRRRGAGGDDGFATAPAGAAAVRIDAGRPHGQAELHNVLRSGCAARGTIGTPTLAQFRAQGPEPAFRRPGARENP